MKLDTYIQDPSNRLKLIAIGRKAGLGLFKQLLAQEQVPARKALLQTALDIEHGIINAAKRGDEEQVDAYIIESGGVFKRLKEIPKE